MQVVKQLFDSIHTNPSVPPPEAMDLIHKYKILLTLGVACLLQHPRTLLCGAIFAAVIIATSEGVNGTQGSQLEIIASPLAKGLKELTGRQVTLIDAAALFALFMVDNLSMLPAFWVGINLCMSAWNELSAKNA